MVTVYEKNLEGRKEMQGRVAVYYAKLAHMQAEG